MTRSERSRAKELVGEMEPRSLSDVLGQPELVGALRELLDISRRRGHPLPPVILVGPAQIGKRAISTALAYDVLESGGAYLESVDAEMVGNAKAMRELLAGVDDNDVLHICDVHRLEPSVYEILRQAISEFEIEEVLSDSLEESTGEVELPLFSAIATTEVDPDGSGPSLEDQAQSDWISLRVVPYELTSLIEIAIHSARQVGASISDEAAQILAEESEGFPGRIQERIAAIVVGLDADEDLKIDESML